jgi:Na+-driven multidrug efflux pump
MVILAWIFAEPVWGLLTPDAALQQVGVGYWHICLLAYPLIALEMTITAILQASGRGMPALVVTAVRTWGVQLPIVWAAARFGWGATGAWMGFLMGNLTCVIISGLWAYLKLRDSGKTVK